MSAIDIPLPMPSQGASARSVWPALLILAFGAFMIGTSEFLIMGILPQVADGLSVSVGLAGQLVAAFAIGIALGAPLLTAFTARFDRRSVLMGALGVFAAANLVVASSDSYAVQMAARFVGGGVGGLFYAVAFGTATQIAPDRIKATAIATVLSGVTLATVLGSPAGLWLAQFLSWQAPFAVLAALTIATIALIRFALPPVKATETHGLKALARVFKMPAVVLVLASAAIANTGWFAGYTYITPYLTDVTGVAPALIASILLGYGIISAFGSMMAGRLADRSLIVSVFASVAAMAVAFMALRFLGGSVVAVLPLLALWAFAAWVFVAANQARTAEAAGTDAGLALALSVSAFNVGNAAGAAVGAVALDWFGLADVMTAGALFSLLAIIPLALSYQSRAKRPASARHCQARQ